MTAFVRGVLPTLNLAPHIILQRILEGSRWSKPIQMGSLARVWGGRVELNVGCDEVYLFGR